VSARLLTTEFNYRQTFESSPWRRKVCVLSLILSLRLKWFMCGHLY